MQEIIRNSYNGTDSLRASLHLRTATNDLFNRQSMLTSESDDFNSGSEDFNIDFNQKPSQDFGLGYWIKHTNNQPYESPLRPKSPDNSAFIPKSNSHTTTNKKRTSRLDNVGNGNGEKSKNSKQNTKAKNSKKNSETKKPASSKFNSNKSNYNIPRLKIPKEVVKKYLKTLSPLSTSSSSSSESESLHNHKKLKHKKIDTATKTKTKSKTTNQSKLSSDTPLSDQNDSSCLQKSFLSTNNSKPQSVYLLSVASHDSMLLSMTIDKKFVFDMSSLPVINNDECTPMKTKDRCQMELVEKKSLKLGDEFLVEKENKETISINNKMNKYNNNHDSNNQIDKSKPLLLNEDQISLSVHCDIPQLDNDKITDATYEEEENDQPIYQQNHNTCSYQRHAATNNRKRVLDSRSKIDLDLGVVAKKKMLETTNTKCDREDQKLPCDVTALDYLKFFKKKMKYFEEVMHEKYCLSQPNAMKFLAQNHALNWEAYKNDLNQLHLVPCEFIAEIFHQALHCYGLEKRTVKETLNIDSSPSARSDSNHFTEYKRVKDEYSFSLKRVRYGIGAIDDLFKRKINFQSTQPNNDVNVVRKWKHLIYYLCLQAKAVFMTKEMQYHNYANYVTQSGTFDGDCNLLFNTTPTARYSSSLVIDAHNKLQFQKDSSRMFESKFIKTTPDHLCQFDMDVSPHSYDSGKGSSIRLSSNGNSQVSGCQTTSSLNSTPHSLNEAQLNLPGFHMYRIDEYLKTANEFIQFLPETLQLHNKIISKTGLEPNANSSDSMLRFINYAEACQHICKQDAMSECLQRLLSQAVRL